MADMFDKEREMCICNSASLGEIVGCIKEHKCQNVDEVIEKCEVGDKCESCVEDGYENDGFSLAFALSRVKQGQL